MKTTWITAFTAFTCPFGGGFGLILKWQFLDYKNVNSKRCLKDL
jgi:hypothetical protein